MKHCFGFVALAVISLLPSAAIGRWSATPGADDIVVSAPRILQSRGAAPDGTGGAFVVYGAGHPSPSHHGAMRLQRLDADGTPRWGTAGRFFGPAGTSYQRPQIVSGLPGMAIFAWTQTSPSRVVRAQAVNAAGDLLWGDAGLRVCSLETSQVLESIISDGAGGAFLAFWDNRSNSGSTLCVQKLSPTGIPLFSYPATAVLEDSGPGYSNPRVFLIPDNSGGLYIVYNGSDDTISVARVNQDGEVTVRPRQVASSVPFHVAAASDGQNGLFLAWETQTGWNVQRIDSQGSLLGPNCLVPAASGAYLSSMVADGQGGVYIVWGEMQSDFGPGEQLAQHIDHSLSPSWPGRGISLLDAGEVGFGIPDGQGGAIVTAQRVDTRGGWNSEPTDAPLLTQRINTSGTLLWGTGGILPSGPDGYVGLNPQPCTDGRGGLLLFYDHSRWAWLSGETDHRGLRITAAGNRGHDGISHFAATQETRTTSPGSSHQVLTFDFATGDLTVPAYTAQTSSAWEHPVRAGEWTGLFLYDYAGGAFTESLYRLKLEP